ncbi:Male sterility protein [Marinobacter daqiaonensis]|uniref:Male sterility protein n=1 Tax=Marinobacter daqiaonensis TaxID=650891 RepID=A0A1I6J8U0_9GAMM|nr:fatty acyl-CoA reductase [Marinobacter daqiaonensis]SFR75358.1 Male sterility protein [Marinobacter daqiaonensis]
MSELFTATDDTGSTVFRSLKGKHILITGTTGFLGKAVLEKIIRGLPEVGGLYLLVRGNARHPDARERFYSEIASSSVFERLRSEDQEAFEAFLEDRVHCIKGELTRPRFGLSQAEYERLTSRIDLVINSAASVNFREELDKALTINTLCLDNVADFARDGDGIPVVQVSTCYVNGINSGDIAETVIKPAGADIPRSDKGYYETGSLVRLLHDKITDVRSRYSGKQLEKKLVELGIREANHYGWSDTYTFTKWLGEQRLMEALSGQSLTIVRPSIIESALKEPMPGWIEGVKVADAIILAYAREKVTLFPGRREGIVDVIPVDLVANSIILAGAEAVMAEPDHRIYQCCSGSMNPVSLGEFIDHVMAEARENHEAYDKLFARQPSKPFIAVNRTLFDAAVTGFRAPLSLASRAMKMTGHNRELKLLRNLDTTRALATIFGFYTAPDYVFHNERLMALAERMGDEDRENFSVDPRRIGWETYLRKTHLGGLNRYAMAERRVYSLRNRRQRKSAVAA